MSDLIQRSFTAGELAPSLRSRADITNYASGLALCENFIPKVQGGVYSRPGTRFIGEIGDSSKRARLIPFSFNTEQTYILVFEDLTMRVIADGGFVFAGEGPALFELTTTYTEAELSRLSFTQSADVMTIVHPNHAPANLSRIAHDNWTLTDIDYSSSVSPPPGVTTTVATITGITQANPAVVTAAAHGFVTGNTVAIASVVGMTEVNGKEFQVTVLSSSTFELQGEDSSAYTAYTSGGTATRADNAVTIGTGFGSYDKTYNYVITTVNEAGIESTPSSTISLTCKSLSETAGIRLSWATVPGADYYRIYKDPSNNTSVFGWIGDSKNLNFDDFNKAPITSDAPPEDRTPFDGVGNKPSSVGYYQQRQVLANTLLEPQVVFTTQTADYNSLRTSNPANDDDAVTFTIAGKEINEIRHIVALDGMLLLTPGGVWRVTEGQDQVLTPSTAGVRIQSYHGASWVSPVNIGDTVIYVQEKGSRVRDLRYEFSSDNYAGNDLSIMAEHLFEGFTIEEMAYSEEPYSVMWCVRDDGQLLGLTYQREQNIWAWHHHVTDGFVESVATITEDDRDALYLSIRRTINGATVRYVERMEIRDVSAAENAFCVDSGVTYNGVPATTISGLDHLEGKVVAVLADGNVVSDLTVSSGSITIPNASSIVHVGLPYTCVMETLDIDLTNAKDSFKAKNMSVSQVSISVESSRGGFIGAKHEQDTTSAEMFEIKPHYDTDGYDAVSLKTFIQEVYVAPLWGKSGGVRIEQRDPLPLAILAVIPDVSIGG